MYVFRSLRSASLTVAGATIACATLACSDGGVAPARELRDDPTTHEFVVGHQTDEYRFVLARADGSAPRVIARLPRSLEGNFLRSPVLSPGRDRIAAAEDRNVDIFATDGRLLLRIPELGGGIADAELAWSPDGERLALSGRGGLPVYAGHVYVFRVDSTVRIDPDGGGSRGVVDVGRVVGDVAPPTAPAWSPDGRRLAYSDENGPTKGLYVVNADGTGRRWLTLGTHPAWSPDGQTIAFVGRLWNGYTRSGVSVIGADGTGERELVPRPPAAPGYSCMDNRPAWSPDGTRLLFFRSDCPPAPSAYVIARDGTATAALTFAPELKETVYTGVFRVDW